MPVSSPLGIYLVLDEIIFSIKVEPHLGIPIIKIGFILQLFLLILLLYLLKTKNIKKKIYKL